MRDLRSSAIALTAAVALSACSDDGANQMRSADAAAPRVSMDDARIRMDGAAGSLLIERQPFRLAFRDAQGKTVLAHVPNPQAAPQPIAALAEPAPLGGELPKTPTLYAPLSYVVGVNLLPQIPAGPWEANPLTGTAAGIAFHATEVLEVRESPGVLELTLATNEPGGRVLELVLQATADGFRLRARPEPAAAVALMSDSFVAEPADAFRGFGGRHNALDQRGSDFLGWFMQQNFGAGQFQPIADLLPGGGPQYLFPNGRTAAYYVSPSFISQRYAFLLQHDELSRWRMASDSADRWQVQVAAPALDYRIFAGQPPQTLAALTELTGRHRLPPDWALGVLLDRATIAFTQTADQYAAQVRDDLARLDEHALRVSGYRIEGWFQLTPALRRELIAEFKQRGIRTLTYFRSFAAVDGAGTENPATFTDAVLGGYTTKTVLGTPYVFGGNFLGPSILIDFTNPSARTWWKGRIKQALDEGADGFMQDFGEQVMGDMFFADGRNGYDLHNRYPVLYHRLTREAIDEWCVASFPLPSREGAGGGGTCDIWFFTRAGYAGLGGSPHYESANFAGDGNTDWSVSAGLASQTPDMLNRALSGAYGFTTDIGGYFDFITPPTTKELFIRWAQWAALSPVMRVHGSVQAGTHMPWHYDAETLAIWRDLTALRYRALPYIRAAWKHAAETGLPITRPLWLIYPEDPEAAAQDQQWLLGEDVLVAPVVTEGAVSHAVYFPEGCWQHGETRERYRGPASVEVAAPLDSLPWFVRCGSRPFLGT